MASLPPQLCSVDLDGGSDVPSQPDRPDTAKIQQSAQTAVATIAIPWVEELCDFRCTVDGRQVLRKAKVRRVYGIGIHKDLDGVGRWVVSHLATSCLMALVETEVDALRIASQLIDDVAVRQCLYLSQDKATLIASLPPWVKPWLYKCYEKHAWTLPEVA